MMPSQITPFRRSAAQCFCGIIALSAVTFVCLWLKADLATTAFIYLAVIVLLSLTPRDGAKARSRGSRKLIYHGSRTHWRMGRLLAKGMTQCQ